MIKELLLCQKISNLVEELEEKNKLKIDLILYNTKIYTNFKIKLDSQLINNN